jgi:hypothetical protein
MTRLFCNSGIYDVSILKTVTLLLLKNGRSNQLYFALKRLLMPVVTGACFIALPQTGDCHSMSRRTLALCVCVCVCVCVRACVRACVCERERERDKCSVLQETTTRQPAY